MSILEFGLDVFGIKDSIKNYFKHASNDWQDFSNHIAKIVHEACAQYCDFINHSPEYQNMEFLIHIVNEYKDSFVNDIVSALAEGKNFDFTMILSSEKGFPPNEKKRLYEFLEAKLKQFSFEYAMRSDIKEIKDRIGTVLENQVPKNKTIDFTMSYDEAYQNAIHSSHAYDIVPEELFQRDDELKLLNEICSNDTGYFLLEANAYTGKSALLSWFFLNPPKDVWMVGYFLVRRIGWADSERFEESIKSQLIALIAPSFIDEQRIVLKEKSITQLLNEAATIAQKHNRKLVVVIDGLDENINANQHKPPVLNLLPKKELQNVIVILSCRPNPNAFDNAFLLSDHIARKSKVYKLSQSQYVKDIQLAAQAELQALCEEENAKRVIAFLATAQGALTITDLCVLADVKYQIDVKNIFSSSTGRTFISITSESMPITKKADKRFTFSHEVLERQAIKDFVGNNAQQYIEKLNDWCDVYRNQKWPLDTPDYLLEDYLRLLKNTGQWERLADLLIDHIYISAISKNTLSCSSYLRIINNTIDALTKKQTIDYLRIGLLTESREWFSSRDNNIPRQMPLLFARLGHCEIAQSMTNTMSDTDRLSCRSEIAVILVQHGLTEKALETAQSIIDEIPFDKFMYQRSSIDSHDYTSYLANCSTVFVKCGHSDKVKDFFVRLITTIISDERFGHGKGEMIFFSHLREIPIAIAQAGDIGLALEKTEMLSYDWQTHGFTLVEIGVQQALNGDFDGALQTAIKAHIVNEFNTEQRNNNHITLQVIKILVLIDNLANDNDEDFSISGGCIEFLNPHSNKTERLDISDLLEIYYDDEHRNLFSEEYYGHSVGQMYIEVAEILAKRNLSKKALGAIKVALPFLAKYMECDSHRKPEDIDRDLLKIAVVEAGCSEVVSAMKTVEKIFDEDCTIEAFAKIARTVFLLGKYGEAESILLMIKLPISTKSKAFNEVIDTIALIKGHEAAIEMLIPISDIKEHIISLCRIAKERLLANDSENAEYVSQYAFSVLSKYEYTLTGLPEHGISTKKYDRKKISKNLFEIGEYHLALKVASLSNNDKWYAKLLIKTAIETMNKEKNEAVKMFTSALSLIKSKMDIDVNKYHFRSRWGDDYDKDHPTITDLVTVANSLIQLDEIDVVKSLFPPYSEFSKLLWQSADMYAYEALCIYLAIGEKDAIEKDLLLIAEQGQLAYAKAWLYPFSDSFDSIDFSNISFSFKRDKTDGSLSISYDDEADDNPRLYFLTDLGFEHKSKISLDFHATLKTLSELCDNESYAELDALIAQLSTPYSDTDDSYEKQSEWCAKRVLLIRHLIKNNVFEKYEYLFNELEEFVSHQDRSLDYLLLWTLTEILLEINKPVGDIINRIRRIYDKKRDDEKNTPNTHTPYCRRVIKALTAILLKYPTETEAIAMLQEVCFYYIAYDYFDDYKVCIEAEKCLGLDLGLQSAYLTSLVTKPWYSSVDLLAHLDIDVLRVIVNESIERMKE